MNRLLIIGLVLTLGTVLAAVQVPGRESVSSEQGAVETLIQLTDKLKKNAGDTALREQIIKLVNETKPAPTIPEEARQHFVEGSTLAKSAKDAAGQKLAVESFQKALLAAPWWADAYYNLAVAQGLAGQIEAAQSSLKFYILTKPGEKEAREAQDKIYELNAKKKLAEAEAAQKEAARRAAEDTPELREKRFMAGLEGAIFSLVFKYPLDPQHNNGVTHGNTRYKYLIRNRELILLRDGWNSRQYEPSLEGGDELDRVPITGRVFTYSSKGVTTQCGPVTVTITDRNIIRTTSCTHIRGTDTATYNRIR